MSLQWAKEKSPVTFYFPVWRGFALMLVLFLNTPAPAADEALFDTLRQRINANTFGLVACTYKTRTDRFELAVGRYTFKRPDFPGHFFRFLDLINIYPESTEVHTNSKGQRMCVATWCDQKAALVYILALTPEGRDVAAFVHHPTGMSEDQLKACLEILPLCADSAAVAEGCPINAGGEPNLKILLRDLGHDPFVYTLLTAGMDPKVIEQSAEKP